MCMAVGNVSLLDCPMFTWSFGRTGCCEPSVPPASWVHRRRVVAGVELVEGGWGRRPQGPGGRALAMRGVANRPPHPGGMQADGQVEDLRCRVAGVRHDALPPFGLALAVWRLERGTST